MAPLKIKWGKEEFDVELDADSTVELFKTQVWTLTQVPVDRQKFLGFPGGMLKDTDNLAEKVAKLKPGTKITLIGTAENKQLTEPTEKVVFEEDLSPEDRIRILKEKKVEILPAGIANMGNTCYMNSVLQCLFHVQDLRKAAAEYSPPNASERDIDSVLTAQYKLVMEQLTKTTEAITPFQFVMALRQRFPRFAEMQNGGYMQQDAEECLRGILQVLGTSLGKDGRNLVDDTCGFKLTSSLRNVECDDEEKIETEETQRFLMCHLGTQTEAVSHIYQGVTLSMKEHIEKQSPILGRNAQYEKSSSIASLPPYLIVQFARFGYKGANEWAGTSASKVKITRKVAFSSSFDLYDCCTDSLKSEISSARLKKKNQDDAELEAERKAAEGNASSSTAADKSGDVEMKPADADVDMKPSDDIEVLDTGYYELVSIVSHKGRTADGGHYVAWALHTKSDGKKGANGKVPEDRWLQYDDETVSMHDWKDIVGLSVDLQGGKPDTQIAYINIYRKVSVKIDKKGPGYTLGTKDEEKKPEEPAKAA